jgi:dipeptidyl-peptidase-4
MSESFPRQKAATRSFRLGAPRNFSLRPGGDLVVFLRTATGRTATTDIWLAEKTDSGWIERCLLESASLSTSGEIPEEELARRERMREVTEGVTAYSTDKDFTKIIYALDGELFLQNLPRHNGAAIEDPMAISTGRGCIDPRLSPDGNHIAFVQAGSLLTINLDTQKVTQLCGPEEDEVNVSWGLADFAAAEELDRVRGYWWTKDSQSLLVERVDESPVDIVWIADPANPRKPAREHRYPFAGTANAEVSLHLVNLNGDVQEIAWNKETHPYLVTVNTTGIATTISVLSRNQQNLEIFQLDDATSISIQTRIEKPWHQLAHGVPTLDNSGQLIEIRPLDGSFRLCIDGEPVSPIGTEVSALVSTDSDLVFTASTEPTNQLLISQIHGIISPEAGVHAAVLEGELMVLVSNHLDSTKATFTLVNAHDPETVLHRFTNNRETPSIIPKVEIHVTGKNELHSAVLWPEDHVAGNKIPVILAPYGGPQHQRVIQAGLSYCSDQWLANQGFAVVITDNRGTPSHGTEFDYAIHGDLASVVIEDQVQALTDLAVKLPDLDLTRVGVHGWSFGGYLAALAVLERPDIFHVAVSGAPVTDWTLYDTAYTERYLGTPQENPEKYEQISLLTKAHKLSRPLLIIHGLADDNVLVANSLRFSSALLAAGKVHSVLPLSGVTHMTPQEIVAENLMLAELEFFQAHLH